MSETKSLEEQIYQSEQKLKCINVKQQSIKDKLSKQNRRKRELVGRYFLELYEAEKKEGELLNLMNDYLNDKYERSAFGLPEKV